MKYIWMLLEAIYLLFKQIYWYFKIRAYTKKNNFISHAEEVEKEVMAALSQTMQYMLSPESYTKEDALAILEEAKRLKRRISAINLGKLRRYSLSTYTRIEQVMTIGMERFCNIISHIEKTYGLP